jgi:hypothetical protein
MDGWERLEREEIALRAAAAQVEPGPAGAEILALAFLEIETEPWHFAGAIEEFCRLTAYRQGRTIERAGRRIAVLVGDGCRPVHFIEKEGRRGTGLAAIGFVIHDPAAWARHLAAAGIACSLADDGTVARTEPSPFTGISIAAVGPAWPVLSGGGVPTPFTVEERPRKGVVGCPDHVAVRVRAQDRAAAVLEFVRITGAVFAGSEYVVPFRSANSVLVLPAARFALNIVSGTVPFTDDAASREAEPFLDRFGPGAHHIGFLTQDAGAVVAAMEAEGISFALPLTGSREEGIRQAMTERSAHTGLMIEYLERSGAFDGFFAPSLSVGLGEGRAPPSPYRG